MKQLPLFLMLVGLFACNSPIHDDLSFSRGDTTRPNTDETKNDNESPELPKDKTLYACGVIYVDGHPSDLVLFKDGLRQFSIKCTRPLTQRARPSYRKTGNPSTNSTPKNT